MPIEEALLLRELIDAHGLTQREAARQCARDVSWVQRRLMLLGGLPEALLQAVRDARVSSWAATRVFVPLARANSEHASRVLASLDAQRLSTRELWTWFDHYQGAQCAKRERMAEHPRLFIDSVLRSDRSVFKLLTADYTYRMIWPLTFGTQIPMSATVTFMAE